MKESKSWFLLGEDNESNELLSTDIRKALISNLLSQVTHEVQNCLTTQHFVAYISAQHDAWLVLQDCGGVAWPNSQPRINELKD